MVALISRPDAAIHAAVADARPAQWNATAAEFPDVCVQQLFEQQVARSPDAVALVFSGQQISYRQLNQRANQVAHALRRRGVGPETLVGVCLPRSPALVIALFGVWKAGAAYVPLDPAYPRERLAFMASDAELRILLSDQASSSLFAEPDLDILCLDVDWPSLAQESQDNPAPSATPDNLAYVMYTSGSSGQPKGVQILQRGLVNYLWWAIAAYRFEAGGSSPLHSSISFDLTVTSLYPPLLVGGQVELLAADVAAQSLLATLRRGTPHNVVKITPAHLELLSQQLPAAELAAMSRAFVIGGENLLAEGLRPWRQHAPATRLINEYGPTETVVGCCVHEVAAGDADSGAVPIGRPIANTRLYVLDPQLRPLPPGESGELYIGGVGVARGYLNRPELTAERFLADPFANDATARMYKSGDLVRRRQDGSLEYLGRLDSQVKVNGYRIELGEIEAQLAAHAAVQSCAVLAPRAASGQRQLVAFVAPRVAGWSASEELQAFLKQRLPEFMRPGRFLLLKAFPLTPNGKVDRQALLDILAGPAATPLRPPAPPRTPLEEGVAAIWRELLNLPDIAIHDDLFDLGARSLQAARAVTQLRAAFAVDLQLRHLFEHPTVAGLAMSIEGLRWLARPAMPTPQGEAREEIEL